jgi:hypothetical protein
MNLIDGEIRAGRCLVDGREVAALAAPDGPCRFGFRPEWATLAAAGSGADSGAALPVAVRATRTLGTVRGVSHGLVIAEHGGIELCTRQDLDGIGAGPAALSIDPDRLIAFREGRRIGMGGDS